VGQRTTSDERQLPAGDFSTWLRQMQGALRGDHDSDVPCDGCTACCTSSQFIPIEPDEVATLARIPRELRFPAPRRPAGHVLLGYDERGHCPMLVDGACSIYEVRPRACRTYDCRVLPAAGVDPTEREKGLLAERARRWQFSHPTERDRAEHDAVRAAAAFLAERREELPAGSVPASDTQRAVLAIEIHETFLHADPADAGTEAAGGRSAVVAPDPAAVRVAISRHVATSST
jgi:Fe-S-cluster containining protein